MTARARPRRGRSGRSPRLRRRLHDPLPSQRQGGERPVERRASTSPSGPVTRRMAGFIALHRPHRHPARREATHAHPGHAAQGRRPALHGRAPRPLPLPRVPPGRDPARRHRQPLLWITGLGLGLAGPVSIRQAGPPAQGDDRDPGRLFRQLRGQPPQSEQAARRVRYGIESRDEMCACHLEFLPEDPSGYQAYPNKSPFGL